MLWEGKPAVRAAKGVTCLTEKDLQLVRQCFMKELTKTMMTENCVIMTETTDLFLST